MLRSTLPLSKTSFIQFCKQATGLCLSPAGKLIAVFPISTDIITYFEAFVKPFYDFFPKKVLPTMPMLALKCCAACAYGLTSSKNFFRKKTPESRIFPSDRSMSSHETDCCRARPASEPVLLGMTEVCLKCVDHLFCHLAHGIGPGAAKQGRRFVFIVDAARGPSQKK